MSNSILKKFAEELKETREKNNLSIDQVFTKTRIDKKFLIAIEEGNFSILPDVYIRAFIKEYSNSIGLNSEEVLRKFELAQSNQDYNFVPETNASKPEEKKSNTEEVIASAVKKDLQSETTIPASSTNKSLYYVLVGFIILLSIFVIYKTFLVEKKTEIVTEKPFEEIVDQQSNRSNQEETSSKTNEKKSETAIITPKKNSLVSKEVNKADIKELNISSNANSPNSEFPVNLTIIGLDQSWMRVVSDGVKNSELILQKDMKRAFSAKEKIYLHIGNSAGVKLILNGKELSFRGSKGRVRKIFITKNGIEYLRRTPAAQNEG